MFFSLTLFEFIVNRLDVIEPVIKLAPIMKLIGNSIVSTNIKLILLLSELFWMPIINSKNKDRLKIMILRTFLIVKNIFY